MGGFITIIVNSLTSIMAFAMNSVTSKAVVLKLEVIEVIFEVIETITKYIRRMLLFLGRVILIGDNSLTSIMSSIMTSAASKALVLNL